MALSSFRSSRWRWVLGLGLVAFGVAIVAHSAAEDSFLKQSRGAGEVKDIDEWRKSEERGGLAPYPIAPPGATNPQGGLPQFGGAGTTSFAGPDLGMPFSTWKTRMETQRPGVDKAAHDTLASRYAMECKTDPKITMSRGKPQPLGPAAKLPAGVASFEELASLAPDVIRSKKIFPYVPLDHPLSSTAHAVFPPTWTRIHPEQIRFDVSFDIPECYLPEYPPPLFLTTHKELGDVTRGVEITYGNYFDMFNGVLTPEQLDGLRLMVTPFQTTWFNVTHHRVTAEPTPGLTCLSCHVNGHSNGAFALAPDSRPNYARLRTDTPTLRGDYAFLIFSSKRSIRSMDHFAEVEEYFDGDTTMLAAIGGRDLQRANTNHMADFNSIIDFPPAPKLDVENKLIASLATPEELRGEAIFTGKGRCASCHAPLTQFTDNTMHDLKVERFYDGRAEGPVKTFSLRGIKDSPPYFHDGRLLTLEDAVEFFDIVLGTKLNPEEKSDLTAYLRAL